MSEASAADHVLHAVRRLTDVLARENAALRRMDIGALGPLAAEKSAALAAATVPAHAAPLPPERRADGRDLRDRLECLMAENRTLLEGGLRAQASVLGIVLRAAARQAEKDNPAYGLPGTPAGAVTRPVAISAQA